jgi:hypothetical protein
MAGAQAFTATATDAAGNVSSISNAVDPTIQAIAAPPSIPAAPVILSDIVNGNAVELSGAAQADSTVTVYDQRSLLGARIEIGTTQTNAEGSWSFVTGALASGAYTFYATAANSAGISSFSAGLDPTVGQADATTSSSNETTLPVTGTVEIAQPSGATFVFQSGNPGQLVLDQPSTFTGIVSGFGAQDSIDLPGIAFGPQTTLGYLPNSNQQGGTLSLTDGNHGVNIALLGSYLASSFVVAGDGHGGSTVVETSQSGDQSLLTNPHHA